MRYVDRDAYGKPGDNRCCGFPTKSGRPCRAHAIMVSNGETFGCYLHDPRRREHENRPADSSNPPPQT
jgi:hypothetical protein